ncbi:MAG: hypothetical protein ACT4PP_16720 [Sporichthyaceae bacterium]
MLKENIEGLAVGRGLEALPAAAQDEPEGPGVGQVDDRGSEGFAVHGVDRVVEPGRLQTQGVHERNGAAEVDRGVVHLD